MKIKKVVPEYMIAPLLLAVSYNFLVYFFGRCIAKNSPHFNFSMGMDYKIPLLPWMIVFYWTCYIFWTVNYILSVRYDKREGQQFILAHFIGETVCFLAFTMLPTTMSRPHIAGNTIAELAVQFQYQIDSADNLFPSIHCFVSWLSWIGVRNNFKINKFYRAFSLAFAVAVCISTLTIKQHVIVDVVAGILLAEFGYYAAGKVMNTQHVKAIA